MTPRDLTAVDRGLAGLPRSESDARRSSRVRSRCHAILARQRAPVPALGSGSGRHRRALESAVVGGFCVIYLCAVAFVALRSHGLL
jgi:hypothetical protein